MIPRKISRNAQGFFVNEPTQSSNHSVSKTMDELLKSIDDFVVSPDASSSFGSYTSPNLAQHPNGTSGKRVLQVSKDDLANLPIHPVVAVVGSLGSSGYAGSPLYPPNRLASESFKVDNSLERESPSNQQRVTESPEVELSRLEQSETDRQRREREKARQKQRAADRAEAVMVAAVREKRLAQDKSSRNVSEFSLLSSLPLNESVLVVEYIKALREMVREDPSLTPIPEDFASPDGYESWNYSVGLNLQEVIRRLLKLRFLVKPEPDSRSDYTTSVNMTFRIIEARGLLAKEGRTRDAYCEIEMGSPEEIAKRRKASKVEVLKTQVVPASVNPKWNQKVTFEAKNLTDRIEVDVVDNAKAQFLGRARFLMADLIERCAREGKSLLSVQLEKRETSKDKYVGGELLVEVELENDRQDRTSVTKAVSFEKIVAELRKYRLNLKSIFFMMLRSCLLLDLHAPPDSRPDLLSIESATLLRLWAREWGISPSFQVLSYLQLVFLRYKDSTLAGRMPVHEVLKAFDILYANVRKEGWFDISERYFSLNLLADMREHFHGHVTRYKELYPKNKPSGNLETAVLILRMIHRFPAYKEAHPELHESFREELRKMLTEACISRFQRYKELTSPFDETDIESVIEGMNKLAEMVSDEIELDDRYFRDAFAKELDIVRLTAENQLKYFVLTLEDSSELLSSPEAVKTAAQMVFALYKRVKLMNERYSKIVPSLASLTSGWNAERWFAPFMGAWLERMSDMTFLWVSNALKADSFQSDDVTSDGIPAHSSSIVDVFSAVYSELEFITDLGWSDPLQNAQFFQTFAKIANNAIEQYCDAITVPDRSVGGTSVTAFAQNLSQNLLGSKLMGPRDIDMESCVKLRNIEFAMGKLQEMHSLMNVSAISHVVKEHSNSERSPRTETLTGAFKIDIAFGENIKPVTKNGLANPYVVIRVPDGTIVPPTESTSPTGKPKEPLVPVILKGSHCELVKSRVIQESLNPNWNQSFEVILPPITRLEAAVFSKNVLTADDLLGTSIIDLTPGTYLRKVLPDLQSHDISVEMEPQGSVMVRLTMGGAVEDIEFWFRRTTQRLIRTRDEFLRLFTSKVSPFSKEVLNRVIKDNEAAPLAKSFFSSLTTATQFSDVTATGVSIHTVFNEYEADAALDSLTDYLNRNLEILCASLSPKMAQEVIKQIWQDCVSIFETILIPNLYGSIDRDRKLLNPRQLSLLRQATRILRDFFHADGEGLGLSPTVLDTKQYRALSSLMSSYFEDLKRLCREYELSLLSGRGDKEPLLRLIRLLYEKSVMEPQDREQGKLWIEKQLLKRKDII